MMVKFYMKFFQLGRFDRVDCSHTLVFWIRGGFIFIIWWVGWSGLPSVAFKADWLSVGLSLQWFKQRCSSKGSIFFPELLSACWSNSGIVEHKEASFAATFKAASAFSPVGASIVSFRSECSRSSIVDSLSCKVLCPLVLLHTHLYGLYWGRV